MKQLRAIIWMRWRMLGHSLRKGTGVLDLIGQILMGLLWGVVALGAGAIVSVLFHEAIAEGRNDFMSYTFTLAFLFAAACGLILPHLIETSRSSMDVSRLLVFPISSRRLFLISQAATIGTFEHLLYLPSLVAVLYFGVIRSGSGILPGLGIIVSMWIFVLVWSHTLGLLVQAIMKKRRNREILGIVFILVLILVVYGPTLFGATREAETLVVETNFDWLTQWLDGSGQILVPVMAAQGLAGLARGESGQVLSCLGWIWAWIVAGFLIGNVFFIKFSIGSRGRIPTGPSKRQQGRTARTKTSTMSHVSRFSFLPVVVIGVAVKEWRTIMRSMNGRTALMFSPVFVAMIVIVYARKLSNPVWGMGIGDTLLFGVFFFTAQILSSLRSNSFTWEGAGVYTYFLSPASLSQVLLGKNLAMLGFHFMVLAINVAVWSVLRGIPSPILLLTGAIFLLGIDLAFMSIDNFLSLTFPSGSDISARTIKSSGIVNLISIAEMIVIGGLHGLFLWAPVWLGWPHLQPVSLLIILVIDISVYLVLLRPASLMFSHNREKIIGNLVRSGD